MTKQDEIQEKFINSTLEFFKENDAGYLELAMRIGKCRISIEVLKRLPSRPINVLVAYPDNKLRDVWISEFEKWNYSNPNIRYVNFSSLKKHVHDRTDFFIIDEFHSASGTERSYCEEIMIRAGNTLALSGTVSVETDEQWCLDRIDVYSTLDGISDGILADYQISVHIVNLDDVVKTTDKKGKSKTEKEKYRAYTWVIETLKRKQENFMHLALARNRLSMSSIGKMKYLRMLLDSLSDKRTLVFTGLSKVADDIGIPSYHSKSKNDGNYKEFQKRTFNHLALAAMGKMGVTYSDLDSVVLLNFTYNAEETSQILNRAIKLDYRGKKADLHILCLNELPELKKIKESLSLLDASKIKYYEN